MIDKSILEVIPKSPGVYLFKDNAGVVIYVGKAKILFNRVKSYFTGNNKDSKTAALTKRISDMEFVVTNTEVEALILENNLIKEHNPRYNISLKDAKSYPFVKITKEVYPVVVKCREERNNIDEYFGPFVDNDYLCALTDIFKKYLKLRACRKKLTPPNTIKPCLNYHINRCYAPCAGYITPEEYSRQVDIARRILSDDTAGIIKFLKNDMVIFSERMDYESAAEVRDLIKAVEGVNQSQIVENQTIPDSDFVGLYNDYNTAVFTIIMVRSGKIIDKQSFVIGDFLSIEELTANFIKTFYLNGVRTPQKIVVIEKPEDKKSIEAAIHQNRSKPTSIVTPVGIAEKRLLKFAIQNSEIVFEEQKYRSDKLNILREIKKTLGLKNIPYIIEGFDVATLSGSVNLGAMVRFKNGVPDKNGYRKFNIKGEGHPDDYAMMEEMLARRYQRVLNEKEEIPDLIVIDGGKGQLRIAEGVLKVLGIESDLIALAKKEEHIFKTGSKPIILDAGSPVLKIIQRVRDESHRFSNKGLRNKIQKNTLVDKLSEVEGIGSHTAIRLINKYGSIKRLAAAGKDEINSLKWISNKTRQNLIKFLKLD